MDLENLDWEQLVHDLETKPVTRRVTYQTNARRDMESVFGVDIDKEMINLIVELTIKERSGCPDDDVEKILSKLCPELIEKLCEKARAKIKEMQ